MMPPMKPRTLILRTAGVNCDQETAHAFALAGSTPEFLHVNQLLERPDRMADCASVRLLA